MKHKALFFFLALVTGCVTTNQNGGGNDQTDQTNYNVELEHWYAAYLNEPTSNNTTLEQKYQNEPLEIGMREFVQNEFQRLKANASSQELNGFKNATVSVDLCSETPILLIQVQTGSAPHICVSPLLLGSIFFESDVKIESGETLLASLYQKLTSWGMDPATFDGSYDRTLNNSIGMTPESWNAVLYGATDPVLERLRGSIDFVLARGLAEIADPKPLSEENWNSSAQQLVFKTNGSFDIASLSSALNQGQEDYPNETWGYEKSGDIKAFINSIQKLH